MQLLDYTFEEIEKIVLELGEPRFRAKQLFEWLTKGAEFDEMKTLPKSFLDKLKEKGYIAQAIHIEDVLVSKLDGTKKYIYRLADGCGCRYGYAIRRYTTCSSYPCSDW